MSQVLTRAEWNNIIDQINGLIANPPVGCTPPGLLANVNPDHIWTKTDILNVQTALSLLCPTNTFDPTPDLWKQKTYDNILSAIAAGWCGCCNLSLGGAGTIIPVYSAPGVPIIGSYAFVTGCTESTGDPCPGFLPTAYHSTASLIQGLQVAPSGFTGRHWSFYGTLFKNGNPFQPYLGDSGIISCDGVIRDAPNHLRAPTLFPTTIQQCYCNFGITTFLDPAPTGYTALIFYVRVEDNGDGCCKP